MPPPIIAVLGATGSQGGGVVAALQSQGKFGIRAVTRNAQKARALADQGVEVVEADMRESLRESLKQVPAHLPQSFAGYARARVHVSPSSAAEVLAAATA